MSTEDETREIDYDKVINATIRETPKDVFEERLAKLRNEQALVRDHGIEEPKMTGVVTRVLQNKGFAIVRSDETGLDHFLHVKEFRGNFELLHEGQHLAFNSAHNPEAGGNGFRALNAEVMK